MLSKTSSLNSCNNLSMKSSSSPFSDRGVFIAFCAFLDTSLVSLKLFFNFFFPFPTPRLELFSHLARALRVYHGVLLMTNWVTTALLLVPARQQYRQRLLWGRLHDHVRTQRQIRIRVDLSQSPQVGDT